MSVTVDRTLIAVDFIKAGSVMPEWVPTAALWPDAIVVERPEIYRETRNPNDILDVAWEAAILVGGLTLGRNYPGRALVEYLPKQWKGQLKKPPHHAALWGVMTPEERALFTAKTKSIIDKACNDLAFGRKPSYSSKVVDLLDAAALNLYHVGRLTKGPIR
jgi:hypothetical protein